VYELKIDTDGDAVADIAYRVRFSLSSAAHKPRVSFALMARKPLVPAMAEK